MVTIMQHDGETDKRKAMIMVSSDDFGTPSESTMSIFRLFHPILTLLTMN